MAEQGVKVVTVTIKNRLPTTYALVAPLLVILLTFVSLRPTFISLQERTRLWQLFIYGLRSPTGSTRSILFTWLPLLPTVSCALALVALSPGLVASLLFPSFP